MYGQPTRFLAVGDAQKTRFASAFGFARHENKPRRFTGMFVARIEMNTSTLISAVANRVLHHLAT